jgi:hypothetical protein
MEHILKMPGTRLQNKFTNIDPPEGENWDFLQCDEHNNSGLEQAKRHNY